MSKFAKRSLTGVVAAACVFISSTAPAQVSPFIAYVAKFVCGDAARDQKGDKQSIGVYSTVINIHYPHYEPQEVLFFKKAVLADPQGVDPRGEVSEFVREQLFSDQALRVTCGNIRALFATPPTGFIEGFLVLELFSPDGQQDLDVVGVYTVRSRKTMKGQSYPTSIDVEQIPPRQLHGVPPWAAK